MVEHNSGKEVNELACRHEGELIPSGKREVAGAVNADTCRELIREAIDSLKYSYTPYSGFKVGAALLTKNHKVYKGCNIENASLTPTNCAERTAFFKAVSEGEKEFLAIAIVGGKDGILEDYCSPCGVCRQVMMEFCNPKNFLVILAKSEYDYWIYSLEELLPLGFGPANLTK
ncbi:cytidine deaminase [Anaerocolumna jejuensis]|jgi:cytidine deaminase|uniref:cytidine deaminase n=1 Tax=Anaerocolumna jejuensis TaxID=259063 RepID=UPI003F7C4884